MPWDPDDVVPRRMLELSKDVLRRCLASRIELEHQLREAREEIHRLNRTIRRLRTRKH